MFKQRDLHANNHGSNPKMKRKGGERSVPQRGVEEEEERRKRGKRGDDGQRR